MSFQIGRLVSDQGIGGGMALVEAIAGESGDLVENLRRLATVNAVIRGALHKGIALGVHLGLDLLTHRPAQHIRPAESVASQNLRRPLHLFLIDHDAKGFGQHRLQLRVHVIGIFLAMLTGDVFGDIGHRPRPIQRNQRDDVLETVGPQFFEGVAHARAFQLEDTNGVTAAKQFKGLGVVQGQTRQIQDQTARVIDQLDRPAQNAQRLQAEKIELHQAGDFDPFHIELRRRHFRAWIAI